MKKQTDIIKKVLRENEFLKPAYYESLDIYTEGNVEEASFATRLHSLSRSITSQISDNQLPPQSLINILSDMEDYLLSFVDEERKGEIEVMFFEGILNTFSHISEDDVRYRYISLFKNNLGPASEALCEQNDLFWKSLLNNMEERLKIGSKKKVRPSKKLKE